MEAPRRAGLLRPTWHANRPQNTAQRTASSYAERDVLLYGAVCERVRGVSTEPMAINAFNVHM